MTDRNKDRLTSSGRFAYEGLHREFHEKARLGIMTSLLLHADGLTFTDLKSLCDLSDGNLNRHLEVLRAAGFIEVDKQGSGRTSKSTCLMTQQGREAFASYLAELEKVVRDAKVHGSKITEKSTGLPKVGFSPS
jgi:DNA-binding transcriptional ArsR family regulator